MKVMNAMRRGFAAAAVAAVAVLALPQSAHAQAWPAKQPIKFVVVYPPGGASDVTARILATKLTESLGQTVFVENKPGANGMIATEFVAKSPPDGYTILMANLGPNAISPAVYKKLAYDGVKDFAPITLTTIVPQIMVVTPTLPVKTPADLIAYTKAKSNKVTFASAGNGASNHLSGELFNGMAGIKMMHVPYKGDAPSIIDVMSGTVDVALPTAIAVMNQVKAGKLKAIGVTGKSRLASLPDVPAISETLPGYEAVSWGGVMAPAGTPPEVIKRLNVEINRILKMPDVAEKLESLGAIIVGSTPEEFGAYVKAEIDKWGKVARENNVTLD